MLPKKALDRLDCEGLELKPSNIIVKAFDGSKRMVHGEVDIPIRVGSQVFDSTFYVMDIRPSYSCLLGRPWIHKAGGSDLYLASKAEVPRKREDCHRARRGRIYGEPPKLVQIH